MEFISIRIELHTNDHLLVMCSPLLIELKGLTIADQPRFLAALSEHEDPHR